MKFKVLDLFSGAGGLSYGLDMLPNFETQIAVDFNDSALKTFHYNMPKVLTLCGDLTDSNFKNEVIEKSREQGINMVVGGPPCQGFSLKGKNLGFDDPRNFLFKEYVHIVKMVRPEVFVIENVKNLINACDGYFIKEIISEMSKLGYITNYGVLNAKDFGVPEHRERTIIIGSLSKSIPLPVSKKTKLITIRDAISDLSYLNSGEGKETDNYKNPPLSEYQINLRNKDGILYNHVATKHSKVALDKLALIPAEGDKTSLPKELHGKQKFSTTWSRLKWDEQSPTIDTRFDTPSNGKNSHPYLNRAITPREAARIQSFPDCFRFLGTKTEICKQIGNAVPPLLAKAIGKAILNAYKDEKTISKNYVLYLGDATSIIKELKADPNFKVNHIITDPPYNISKINNFSTLSGNRVGIDFGSRDLNFNVCSWIKDFVDILDDNGSIIIFCSYLYISFIANEMKMNGIDVKDVLVWQKTNPMPRNTTRRYVQDMEFAIWGVKKGAKRTFNKETKVPYLRSLFKAPIVAGSEKLNHPTQKSLQIMSDIIKIHTNKNDVILDPFSGTATTGEACLLNGRKYIGIEITPKYYELSVKRLLKYN